MESILALAIIIGVATLGALLMNKQTTNNSRVNHRRIIKKTN
jgi:hypothetical protein